MRFSVADSYVPSCAALRVGVAVIEIIFGPTVAGIRRILGSATYEVTEKTGKNRRNYGDGQFAYAFVEAGTL